MFIILFMMKSLLGVDKASSARNSSRIWLDLIEMIHVFAGESTLRVLEVECPADRVYCVVRNRYFCHTC